MASFEVALAFVVHNIVVGIVAYTVVHTVADMPFVVVVVEVVAVAVAHNMFVDILFDMTVADIVEGIVVVVVALELFEVVKVEP